jgi:hypothetical protein
MFTRTDSDLIAPALWIYIWLFGMTHFVLTLTIYLQSANLRFFASTWQNRLLYFAIPAAIFIQFDLYHVLNLENIPLNGPSWAGLLTVGLLLRFGIRLADFNHLNRQSFGVFQLFKAQSGCKFPRWMKAIENWFFLGLTLLLLMVFANDGSFPLQFGMDTPMTFFHYATLALLVMTLVLLLVVGFGFYLAWKSAPETGNLGKPAAYFLLQSVSATFAMISLPLYSICLAIHYVEYHVLMAPRCFQTPLDPQKRVDRFFAALRRNKVVFYGILILLAALATYLVQGMAPYLKEWVEAKGSTPYLALIFLFDGLMVFHYFIEALIWRFSDPFYRKTLGPLYFPS